MALQHEGVHYASVKAFVNEDGFKKIKLTLIVSDENIVKEHSFRQMVGIKTVRHFCAPLLISPRAARDSS
jgi:hypothetical protein